MTNPNPTEKSMIQKKKIMLHKTKEYATDVISTPTVESWEEELKQILIEWEGKDNAILGAVRVLSRTKRLKQFISSQIQQSEERLVERMKVTENTSDGYHTFKELYEFRKLYNAIIFNEWSSQGKYNIHKSKKHFDGEDCFGGGWFIVMATLPAGQISNHYELSDWDLFNCEERERAEKWDGHTAQDVAKRLLASLKEKHDK